MNPEIQKELKMAFDAEKQTPLDRAVQHAGYIHPRRCSGSAVASLWGFSPNRISVWYHDEGCPRNQNDQKNPSYNLADVIKWREDNFKRKKKPVANSDEDIELTTWRERLQKESAQLKQIQRLEKIGQLIPTGALRAVHARLATILKSCGERLGRKFGSEAQITLNNSIKEFEDESEHFIQAQLAKSDELVDEELDDATSSDNE